MQQTKWIREFSANGAVVEIEFTCIYEGKRVIQTPSVDPTQFGRQFARLCAFMGHYEIGQAMAEVIGKIENYMKREAYDDAECALVEAA